MLELKKETESSVSFSNCTGSTRLFSRIPYATEPPDPASGNRRR